jgi:hypothetical protein
LTLQDLGSLGEFIAAIATLVTLVYLAAQIRQNTNGVRSATSASISDALSRGTETLSSDPELTRIWFLGRENYESLTDEEQLRFGVYLLTYFRRLENAFYQMERGFVDPDHWQTTERFFANIMSHPGVLHYWKRSKPQFSDRFQRFVDARISEASAA